MSRTREDQAGAALAHNRAEHVGAGHWHAIGGNDDVAHLDARLAGRAGRLDACNLHPGALADLHRLGADSQRPARGRSGRRPVRVGNRGRIWQVFCGCRWVCRP